MSEHSYRVIELVGTSHDSLEAAITNAVARAAETTRHLDWFEVTEIRGQLLDGNIEYFQVGLKVGFRIESADAAS